MGFVTRFAPSPTGRLHLGHAYSAMLAHDAAATAGGVFLLRIEDIDHGRCREPFVDAITEDLSWLGLHWPEPVRRQSRHMAEYGLALERLRAMGVIYRCFLTRREVAEQSLSAPHGEAASKVYSGPAVHLSHDEEQERLARGEPFAWRLSINNSQDLLGEEFVRLGFVERAPGSNVEQFVTANPQSVGDVILARKDTPASYHLCVVHDDALQGVTHVIRGEDLREATHVHVLLQHLLGWPTPVYHHHRLLVGADGRRYAKRDNAVTLAALREAGATPADIRAQVGLT